MRSLDEPKKKSWPRKALNYAWNTLVSFDQFAESFTMKLDKDKDVVQTSFGACCSLILAFIVLAYCYQKADVWYSKTGNIIMMSTQQNAFPYDE